ncbi:MAG: hypothetical protein FJX75_17750 [Armatimonadetes bacterium]|nr:hypothetical protein [Armatimonadota bacterium]
MSCPYGREDLSAYIDAEVDESTHSGIREHLRACPKCRREVAWLKTLAGMVAGLPRVEPAASITWDAERSGPAAAPTLRCPVVLPEASAFIDGELSPEEAHAVVAHLAACDPCHRAYRDIERISGMMTATEPASVPAGLEARIVAALAAERRFSLRRLFSRTCETCFPVARVSLRFAAAAALLLVVALGVWYVVAPAGVPETPVFGLTPTVAGVPETGSPPTAGAPATTRPAREPDRYVAAEARVTPPRSTPVGDRGSSPRPVERPTAAGGRGAPTVVRPPGGSAPTPVGPGPASPSSPGPAESAPRTMLAALSPSQPSPPAVPETPVPRLPPSAPGKSTPQGDGLRRPGLPEPPLVRLANLPGPAPAEGDADVHVHVTRSGAEGPVPAARGIAPDHLRAAEARVNESTRAFARSQPTRFPINH